MGPSELADLFEANPDGAFRLTLSSGDVVDVTRPRQTLVSASVVYINLYDDPDARVAIGSRIVSIPNIALVEHVDPRRPRGLRRRQP